MSYTKFDNGVIFNGDCLNLMKNLPDKSVDMVCTDIPYGVVNRKDNGLRNFNKEQADIINFDISDLIIQFNRVVSGSFYIFCSTEQVSQLRKELINLGLTTRLIIWEKSNPSPMNGQHVWLSNVECCVYGKNKNATFNQHCKGTVFKFPCGRNKIHPTQKPIELFELLIRSSSNENDTILDPFSGSGTTAIACINTNRRFICMEKEEKYYNLSVERVEKYIKEKHGE